MHPLNRLFQQARQYRSELIWASIFSVLNKLFDVLPEVLIGIAVDVVVNKKASFLSRFGLVAPEHQLICLALITGFVWVFESTFEYLYQLRWRNLAQNLQHDLRMKSYAHVQRLELSWFEQMRTGKLMSTLNDDINQMERFLNGGASDLIQVLTGSLLVGAVFFALTAKIAFLALLPIPLIIYGAFWFQARLAPRYAAVREAAGALNARLANNLLGIATIKAYAAEDYEVAHIQQSSDDYRARNALAIRFSAAITPVIRLAILVGFIVTLLYGGFLALRGEIGVGSYSVLVYLTQRLLWPMTRLADMSDLYQRSMASVERVLNLIETPVNISYAGAPLLAADVKGELLFESVDFAYSEVPTLKAVTLKVKAGQTVALVGGTGSGKSTLIKLLLRFYQPARGNILLDGRPIAEIDLQALRRCIGYVAQDSFLADASAAENIGYGLSNVSRQQIIDAAIAAEAHDFIMALPGGYDAQLGERGQKLSGGQRQRIALARAVVRNPPILLLDEATSAVDNETEAAIQRSLQQLAQGRTCLIVAHRLSTVRRADCIYVMDEGRIVEAGTHTELLAHGAVYAGLWRLQTGEELS